MDKSHSTGSPGYETQDTNAAGVFKFLVGLSLMVIFTTLLCWGLFRYFSAVYAPAKPASPFAETRQLPTGPQLQVYPQQDLSKFLEQQQSSLESYAWENRQVGTVRVPIELAMKLLLEKGLPVATSSGEAASTTSPGRTPAKNVPHPKRQTRPKQ